MKRIYITPTTLIIEVEEEESMLQSSSEESQVSVTSLGNEYNSDDVSYTKEESGGIWDKEW